ncbi:MAG TPA: hypothetical protein VGR91_17350 [Stellaceae bacterium]|nr:hypothetical protein [Stellaceae bacterium]
MVRQFVAALTLCLSASVAFAQSQFPTPAPNSVVRGTVMLIPNGQSLGGQPVMAPPTATNPLPIQQNPSSGSGSVTAVTLGTISTQVLAAVTSRKFLSIDNESASAAIACALGTAAAINAAGSFTIEPGWTRTWDGSFVPSDAVNCIAASGSTPVTVEAN